MPVEKKRTTVKKDLDGDKKKRSKKPIPKSVVDATTKLSEKADKIAKNKKKFNDKFQKGNKKWTGKNNHKKGGNKNGEKKEEEEKKVVTDDPDSLGWTTVEIDRRVNDFEGFFGLEELEGVTVEREEDGKLKFIQKEKKQKKNQKEEATEEDAILNEGEKEESDDDDNSQGEYSDFEVEGKDDVNENEKNESGSVEDNKEEDEVKELKPKKSTQTKKEIKKSEIKQESLEEDEEDQIEDIFTPLEDVKVDISKLNWDFNDDGATHLSQYAYNALASLQFNTPTAIQVQSIPLVLKDRDVIGKAATGSGKTLAYGLPILEKHIELVADLKKEGTVKDWPTGIIFSPTRELAIQIVKHITALAKHYPIRGGSGIVPITGGLAIQKQQRLVQNKPAIVVATPGRFLELLESSNAVIELFAKAEVLVLDEADRMLQEGHFKELDEILDLLGRGKKSKRQTLVFSATFQRDFMKKLGSKDHNKKLTNSIGSSGRLSSNEEAIVHLKKKLRFKDNNPAFVDANPAEAVASKVHEAIIECGAMEKDLYLYYFTLLYPGRTIVFVNSIDAVKRLQPLLKELGMSATGLHSNMIQKQRLRSLERFRENENSILIATDVAARGLDIPLIQHVVHYNLPRTADMYVHRSGRTARAGSEGVSVIICSPEEASGPLIKLKKVLYKDNVRSKNPLVSFDVDYDIVGRIRRRVVLAKKITDSRQESTYKGKDDSWLKDAANDLGVDLDDLEDASKSRKGWMSFDKKSQESKILNKGEATKLREELTELLRKPVMNRSGRYLTNGSVNLAQMVLSGQSHDVVIGAKKSTALDSLANPRKKQKKL